MSKVYEVVFHMEEDWFQEMLNWIDFKSEYMDEDSIFTLISKEEI